MQTAIIIVNWNSRDFLRACVTSILRYCDPKAVEVVVVDGGSFDGCAEMLERDFPSVKFVQSAENIGFARANNLGVRHSSADLLLFLNPDTELIDDSVAVLRRHIESLPQAGIVGCRLLNTDGTVQTSCVQRYPTVLNQVLDAECLRRWFPTWRLWGPRMDEQLRDPVEVEAIIGACMCMTRELFLEVGGFTESYFMYGEDLDLCFKVRQLTHRVYHVRDAEIVHHGGGSTPEQLSSLSNIMMRESIYRFLHLRSGIVSAQTYRAAIGLSAVPRIAVTMAAIVWSRFGTGNAVRPTASLRKWIGILRWSLYLSRGRRPA